MFKTAKIIFLGFLIGFLSSSLEVSAQAKNEAINYNLLKMASDKQLSPVNRSMNVFSEKDREGIYISSNPREGIVWIDSVEFETGIIDLDMRGRDVFQKSFTGIAFHGVNDSTFEAVYFRPFNFNTSDPVRKIHAVQYVSHPSYPWQRLRESKNGQYEKGINSPPNAEEWFHAKFVITRDSVEVFIDGNESSILKIQRLSDRKSGRIGLWVGDGSDGYFANLKLTKIKFD